MTEADTQLAIDRFWSRVQVGDEDECWIWKHTVWERYGTFWWKDRTQGAHRVAYQIAHGTIPSGMCILHSCDTPLCCNPKHLTLGTQSENVRDMVRKGRAHRKLDEAEVLDIRRRHKAGEGIRALGRHYGVTKTTIQGIVHGRRWRHLLAP